MKQTKIINKIHHHHYDKSLNYLFGWLMILLVTLLVAGWIGHSVRENQVVYNKCVDSCSKKHFMGLEIGEDCSRVEGCNSYNYVIEFDRTDCIENCNRMYIKNKAIGD